jgi:hypothetical protein
MRTTEDYLLYLYPDYLRIQKERPKNDTVLKIKQAISPLTGIAPSKFDEKIQDKAHVASRQLLATILKIFTPLTLTEIGNYIGGKDHATILFTFKKVACFHETDRQYRQNFNLLIKAAESIMLRNYIDKPEKHYKGLSREVWKQEYKDLLANIGVSQPAAIKIAIQPKTMDQSIYILQLEEILRDKEREIRQLTGQVQRLKMKNHYSYID